MKVSCPYDYFPLNYNKNFNKKITRKIKTDHLDAPNIQNLLTEITMVKIRFLIKTGKKTMIVKPIHFSFNSDYKSKTIAVKKYIDTIIYIHTIIT